MKQFQIALVIAISVASGFAQTPKVKSAKPSVLKIGGKGSKLPQKEENVEELTAAIRQLCGDEYEQYANKTLVGKYGKYTSDYTISSGNVFADGLGFKGKFVVQWAGKIETVLPGQNKVHVQKSEYKILSQGGAQWADAPPNRSTLINGLDREVGQTQGVDFTTTLNSILWEQHTGKSVSKSSARHAIWLMENGSVGQIDTSAWVIADLGFPVVANMAVWGNTAESARAKGIDEKIIEPLVESQAKLLKEYKIDTLEGDEKAKRLITEMKALRNMLESINKS